MIPAYNTCILSLAFALTLACSSGSGSGADAGLGGSSGSGGFGAFGGSDGTGFDYAAFEESLQTQEEDEQFTDPDKYPLVYRAW